MDDDTGSMTGSSDEAPIRTCSEFEGPLVVDTIDGCERDPDTIPSDSSIEQTGVPANSGR
jgi:hypothetical protein